MLRIGKMRELRKRAEMTYYDKIREVLLAAGVVEVALDSDIMPVGDIGFRLIPEARTAAPPETRYRLMLWTFNANAKENLGLAEEAIDALVETLQENINPMIIDSVERLEYSNPTDFMPGLEAKSLTSTRFVTHELTLRTLGT